MAMTPAGWYDDPLTPGGKRFWDGNQWTDHVQAPPASPATNLRSGPPIHGDPAAAPFADALFADAPFADAPFADAPFGGATALIGDSVRSEGYGDHELNDIGSWIRRSFKMVRRQIVPLSLYIAMQFAVFAVAYLLFDRLLRNLSFDNNADELIGFEAGAAIAVAVLFFASALVGLVGLLASYHNLYAAHIGRAQTFADSLVVGFGRMLRYLGLSILLMVVFYLIAGIAVGIVVGVAALVGGDSPIVILVAVALYIAAVIFLIFASVKLTFLPVATSVVPARDSALKAAWRASDGRFWAVFGRVLLLGLVVGALTMIPYLVLVFLVPALLFSQLDLNGDGDISIDGQPIDSLDVFEFSSILPDPVPMLVIFGISFFLFGLIRAVSYSGTSALYADLGGLNSFAHRR